MRRLIFSMGIVLLLTAINASSHANTVPSVKDFSPEVYAKIIQNLEDMNAMLENARLILTDIHHDLDVSWNFLKQGVDNPNAAEQLLKRIQKLLDKCASTVKFAGFNQYPVFFNPDTGEYTREYPVTLSPSDPTYKIILSADKFNPEAFTKLGNELLPSEMSMNYGIGQVNKLIQAVSDECAIINAYQTRLDYAIRFTEILSMGYPDEVFQEKMKKLYFDADTFLFKLALGSANGIWGAEDRWEIDFHFKELFDELKRYEKITGIKGMFADLKNPTLLTQKDSEALMILMAKKFADVKK
ncbi:MAG: hypothetical protein HPY53_05100 [Brevinematales bacterium]|nr:hypothetical protein [Brevinematales bacterium]